jgi:hypothetical protein
MGKHRTEATEVTEGDWGYRPENFIGNALASEREKSAIGESIAQRPQRSQRGIGVTGQKILSVTPWLPGEKQAQRGKVRRIRNERVE